MSIIEQVGESKLVIVKSQNKRKETDTTTKFSVDLTSGAPLHKVRRVVVKSVQFINMAYNVSDEITTFALEMGVAPLLVTVSLPSAGFYGAKKFGSPSEPKNSLPYILENALNTKLAITHPGTTVEITLDPITAKYRFDMTGNTFDFASDQDSPLNRILGVGTVGSLSASQDAETMPRLIGLRRVHIVSHKLAGNNSVTSDGRSTNTLVNFAVNVPFGTTMYYEPKDDELSSINYKVPRDISNIDIEVQDESGKIVDNNEFNIVITLKVYF